jgi:hypothetical protein
MQACVNAATRAHATGKPTTVAEIQQVVGQSKAQAQNALIMGIQLRLLAPHSEGGYNYIGSSNLRNSLRDGLPQFFRAAAQQFPPFLFYINFLAKGYPEIEAVRQTASIFGLNLEVNRLARVFGRWGKYSGIIDAQGQLDFTPQEILGLGFLSRLHDALRAQLSTQTFVIEELGNLTAAEFYQAGLDVDSIARALVNHDDDPKASIREVGTLLETYLGPISLALGGPGSNLHEIAVHLTSAKRAKILKTHRNLTIGVAGFRNAAAHGSDPDTGKPWKLTGEAALVGALLTMLTMKSVARFLRDGTQEV